MAKIFLILMILSSLLLFACSKETPGNDLPALITSEEARKDAAGINEKNAAGEAEKLLKEVEGDFE